MNEHENKRVDSLIYSCAKCMILAGNKLVDIGNIEYNGKRYRATLEVTELKPPTSAQAKGCETTKYEGHYKCRKGSLCPDCEPTSNEGT